MRSGGKSRDVRESRVQGQPSRAGGQPGEGPVPLLAGPSLELALRSLPGLLLPPCLGGALRPWGSVLLVHRGPQGRGDVTLSTDDPRPSLNKATESSQHLSLPRPAQWPGASGIGLWQRSHSPPQALRQDTQRPCRMPTGVGSPWLPRQCVAAVQHWGQEPGMPGDRPRATGRKGCAGLWLVLCTGLPSLCWLGHPLCVRLPAVPPGGEGRCPRPLQARPPHAASTVPLAHPDAPQRL